MNCDYVFECLTRGPFPTGGSEDAAVEKHLRSCHECRRLAHSLQPAVGLFHENMVVTDGLPTYQGELATAVKNAPVEPPIALAPPPKAPWLVSQFAGIAVLAVVCILFGYFAFAEPHSRPASPVGDSLAVNTPTVAIRLAALDLPPQCTSINGSADNLRCCTDCHSAATNHAEKIADFAKLTNSCMVCHTE